MNVYIVSLEGGGDLFVKVVDKETYNWITSDSDGRPTTEPPEGESWRYVWPDQLVPASQIAKMKATAGEHYEPLMITSGSWDNDRAISAQPADGYDHYDTFKEALQAIKRHKDSLTDEYHGCFY